MLPKVYIPSDIVWYSKDSADREITGTKCVNMERLRKIDHPEGKRQNYISNNAVAKYRMQLHPSLFMIVKHNECAV